jgi:DNA-binding response OmpR family regulator
MDDFQRAGSQIQPVAARRLVAQGRCYSAVMAKSVLVAEDNTMQAEMLGHYLRQEGYSVRIVHDGRSAIDEARRERPDLLILDVMMPKVDGLDVARVLRVESDMPIIMLTARSTEDDLLLGLDLGADDYVTKPYSPRELMARVRTLLRRVRRMDGPASSTFVVGALVIDPDRHELRVGDAPVECTASEFRIMQTLAALPGRVFSRGQLLSAVHGLNGYITERTIDAHVMNLRKKIEPRPRQPVYLLTVHGVGYKLVDGSSPGRAR